jgi:molybdenum cofactor cytidylyltransferase
VHRPERFAELSGLSPGAEITPASLARVLCSQQGGLKNIPAGARRVALLNQADTPQKQAQAFSLVKDLLVHFQAVLVAALAPPEGIEADRQEAGLPGGSLVSAAHEPVAGIILAAGASRRLGQPKQLLPWRGEPMARHVARTALAAGLSPVVAVSGAYSEQVQAALADLPVSLVYNPDWESGQSTSVKAGLQALPPETGAAVFLLVDQPQVTPNLIRSLVELHAFGLSPLVAPQAGGRRANPVLFDRLTFPDLMSLSGDSGGRVLFSRYQAVWLPWHDESLLLDVDTPEDYQRLLELGE